MDSASQWCLIALLLTGDALAATSLPVHSTTSKADSSDELDLKIEYKARALMSPLLYKIMKASGHTAFADGTVKGAIKATDFQFDIGVETVTAEQDQGGDEPLPSIIGNPPLSKRGQAENDTSVIHHLVETLKKYLAQDD